MEKFQTEVLHEADVPGKGRCSIFVAVPLLSCVQPHGL